MLSLMINGKKVAASAEAQTLKVAVKNGDSLVVIDQTTGKSPNKLMTKKVKKDLQIFEEGSDKASVVLEDYYAEGNVVELSGVSQSGSMMTYSVADGGLTLTPAATAEAATVASATTGSGFLGSTASYVLGGLAVIGGGVAVAANNGSSDAAPAADTT
ncbi:MAG: hypothetical protein IE936_09775, partial [Moraxella osloensis]|nr:hypothetical protein [Moraxella osloensis]